MDPYLSSKACNDTVLKLLRSYNGSHGVFSQYNITFDALSNLTRYCNDAKLMEDGDKYSEPMSWVGIYILMASYLCFTGMMLDLDFGFRNKKIWYPCKYFSLNATSITLIAIAMKLPLDLTGPMPSNIDQVTKLGSLAFMCTMMAHFMPSLGSMDNNTLLANIMGLIILVIPMIINICIETVTGVIHDGYYKLAAYIYISLMFFLLLILISLSIAAPAIKENFETEYQVRSGRISNDQHIGLSMENLRQHVRRYWIMAETDVPEDRVEKLFKCVGGGLSYTHLMEKILNTSSEYVDVEGASVKLWREVEDTSMWLENPLKGNAFDGKTIEEILNWFANKAQEIVTNINASTDRLMVANSMYRITKTVLHEYITNNHISDQEELFEILSCMIADILSACLIGNIPEFIRKKCQGSLMEKEREASVQAAARFLCRNEDIITQLEARQVPRMDPSKLMFIDEWRLHLMSA